MYLLVGLVELFVVGDVFLIRIAFVVDIAGFVKRDFVVDTVFLGTGVLLVDGNLLGLEETHFDGPIKKEDTFLVASFGANLF